MFGHFQKSKKHWHSPVVHGGLSLGKGTVNESKSGCFEQSECGTHAEHSRHGAFLQTKVYADMMNGGHQNGGPIQPSRIGIQHDIAIGFLEIGLSFWIILAPFTTEVPDAGLILLRRSIP